MYFFRAFVITMTLVGLGPSMVCAAEEPVAFIVRVAPSNALEKKLIVVKRQGINVDFAKDLTQALYLGDRIFISNPEAFLTLYVNNQQEQHITAQQAGKDGFVLQIKPNSVWRNLTAYLNPISRPVVVSTSVATTRGEDELNMPADAIKPPPKIAAGDRALHFRWFGGNPPYRLTILQHAKVMSEVEVIETHAVSLPRRDWQAGEYQLVLKHSVGLPEVKGQESWQDDRLIFVTPADIPPMPEEIANAELPEEMRQLLYADWISRQDEGEWIMEAIQRLTPFAKGNYAVANWLRQWGGE